MDQKWTGTDSNRQKPTEMDRNRQKRTETDKNGQNGQGVEQKKTFKKVCHRCPCRGRRFEPQSHPPRRIVEISNRPPNLSAKQSEVTVHTKNRPPRTKSAKEKVLF